MKTFFLAAFMFFAALSHAQDLSNFLVPNGFHLPALRSGQYILTVTPSYSNRPYDNSGNSISGNPVSASVNTSSSSYSVFRLATSAVYGISDATTLSLLISFTPAQTNGDYTYSYLYSSQSSSSLGTAKGESRENSFNPSFILSHRVEHNIELSLVTRNMFHKNLPSKTCGDRSIEALQKRGVRFIGCNRSLRSMAKDLAKNLNGNEDLIRDELLANILPGIIIVPAMIVAANRAQEAGMTYVYLG
ncbi:MAG: hypothetical protein HY033_00625 [Ignavibacteriae bacterium]|nr:hypothetical protein [Ignavibacteria bacterium]MBI3363393.1 hypothetical protein [Ignavibacteriota bacterium]